MTISVIRVLISPLGLGLGSVYILLLVFMHNSDKANTIIVVSATNGIHC